MRQGVTVTTAPDARPARRRRRSRALNTGVVVGGAIVLALVLAAVLAPALTPYAPDDADLLERLKGPSAAHLLGTDALGQDILTRLLYGARVSLIVGVGSVLAAGVAGVPIGLLAGYSRGRIDAVLMRVMDMMLSVPKILLAILIMAVSGAGIGNLILAIGLWNVPVFARITRATTMSLREREFIVAAEATGNPPWRIMFRHVLPNALSEIIVIATLAIANAIMAESGLSFLGLGVPPNVPSWGMVLSEGRAYLRASPHITTFAGLAIMIAILGFNLLGDGLRDANDPHRGRRRSRRH